MLNDSSRTPLVIDGDLRTITVPTDYVFGVYNDKDVLAVPFVCPRYIDDIDLSELSIRVNFTNSVGTSSYYDVPSTDKTVNTDTIEFTWLLGSAVFTGSGEVTFAVCLRKVEEDGRITREFNTTLASAKVLEGLEVENQNDPAQYSILTTLQNIVDSVNSSIESAEEYAEQLRNYVGSPLVANTSTDMVDVSRVYVYTGNETGYSNGHWYYYNNATWHDGGNYNAVANGIYPDLTAGNVLLGRTQSDRAPYLLRKTGNRLNKVGYSCYETIVGASVGWNQLANRTITSGTYGQMTVVVDGEVITITGSPDSTQIAYLCPNSTVLTANHKYLMYGNLGGNISTNDGSLFIESDGTYYYDKGNGVIVTPLTNGTKTLGAVFSAGNTYSRKYIPQFVDLTALLGSTIADYIYSLESATAGSGIAKLREWGFLKGSLAFNAGSIESVEVTDKVVRGFNAWDEETRNGYYNTNGVFVQNSGYLACKNLIPVIPNTSYCIACANKNIGRLCFYDSNESFVSTVTATSSVAIYTFTTPSNCYYMAFDMTGSYGTTYNNDICISISSDRNGEYEPYTSQSYPLGNDTLRGIFKLDANNNLYADGDTKSADGVITRKYNTLIINGDTDVLTGASGFPFRISLPDASVPTSTSDMPNAIADKLQIITQSSTWGTPFTLSLATNHNIYFKLSDSITTIEDAKTYLASNPITLVYELATPTTEQSTPFTSPQIVYPDGTEEFITTNSVPVGHETNYPYDMKSISEELLDIPDVPSTNGTYVLKATRSSSGLTYTWVTG